MDILVEQVTQVTADLVEVLPSLLDQLSTSGATCTPLELQEVVASDSTTLLVARVNGRVAGMLTLLAARIPTGVRAIIEDVVVDAAFRGKGIGAALVEGAIDEARRRGASKIDLTSNDARQAAIRLYRRAGFERRSTNVFRLSLADGNSAPPGATDARPHRPRLPEPC